MGWILAPVAALPSCLSPLRLQLAAANYSAYTEYASRLKIHRKFTRALRLYLAKSSFDLPRLFMSTIFSFFQYYCRHVSYRQQFVDKSDEWEKRLPLDCMQWWQQRQQPAPAIPSVHRAVLCVFACCMLISWYPMLKFFYRW